jgi:hypothetical protein
LLIGDIFKPKKRLKRQNKISDKIEKAIMKMRNNSHDLIKEVINIMDADMQRQMALLRFSIIAPLCSDTYGAPSKGDNSICCTTVISVPETQPGEALAREYLPH